MTSFTLRHELHGEGAHKLFGPAKDAVSAGATTEATPDLVELADRLGREPFSVLGGVAVGQRLLRRTWMTSSAGTPIARDETPLELIRVVEDFRRADGADGADGADRATEGERV